MLAYTGAVKRAAHALSREMGYQDDGPPVLERPADD